jgi:CheY-like chemotaxis protein
LKILIIDDDHDIQEIASVSLRTLGQMEVIVAESGPEGLGKAAQEQPDAILLDVMMPGMDGRATLAALRRDPATASIPVIFLTARPREAGAESGDEPGVAGVLAKPFDAVALPARVRAILEGR